MYKDSSFGHSDSKIWMPAGVRRVQPLRSSEITFSPQRLPIIFTSWSIIVVYPKWSDLRLFRPLGPPDIDNPVERTYLLLSGPITSALVLSDLVSVIFLLPTKTEAMQRCSRRLHSRPTRSDWLECQFKMMTFDFF